MRLDPEPDRELARMLAAAQTTLGRLQDRERALAAGYDAHLVKPLPPNALVQAVVDLLRRTLGDTQQRS